jgi:hypothetical protein
VLIERMIESLSMTLAVIGMCSQICTSPLVGIGLKGPPVEAPGLRSQMSIVEGPPLIHSRIADLWFFLSSAACVRRLWPSVRAGMVRADAPARWLRKWRRDMPVGVANIYVLQSG